MAFDKLKNLLNVGIDDGERGQAVVQSSSPRNFRARSYNAKMWLDVYVEGRKPYRVEHECMVKADKHPEPGTRLPVMVDRVNGQRIDIQWDELQTVDERMAAGSPAPVGGAQADQIRETVATGPGSGENAVDARLAQLERLGKLRDAGVLSQEEFGQQKARVLGGG